MALDQQDLDTFGDLQIHVQPRPVVDTDDIKKTAAGDLSVTVTELSSPPSPTMSAAAADEPPACASMAPDTFPYFPLLPAELRLKIWHMSFLPRTVELHTRRTHYADDEYLMHGATPKWQSESRNPAALSVSTEARDAALEHYTVALPLAVAPAPQPYSTFVGSRDILQESDRVLYLNLEQDTVVLLGDLHFARMTRLLEWFRDADMPLVRRRGAAVTRGKGLRRLAMSVAPWWTEVAAATLKAFARTVFADLEQFALFMYSATIPPPSWTGGQCVLEDASPDADYYRRYVVGKGRQFRVGDGWMVVGQRPMKVSDLTFDDGW